MLSVLILIPLLGVLIIGLWSSANTQHIKTLALILAGIALGWTVFLGWQFDLSNPHFQFQEYLPWIDTLGLSYQIGIDGLSLPLLGLNSLLTLIAIYSSEDSIKRPRLYYSLMLLLNSAVVGAFVAQNLLLFFLFYELELIPLYLLIAIWGGSKRGYAATKFLIYTAVSGILVLGAFLATTWLSGSPSFDYDSLLIKSIPLGQQLILLGGLLIGFGIKIPLVPLHTWLPDAHVEASTPVSVLLAGVLLKLGTYGLLRFGLGLFPSAWTILAPWLATWAAVTVLYASLTAIAQTDMKKIVAYSSVAHMGYVLLGAAAMTDLGILASIFQMVSHGLISAMLFLLVGVVYQKTGSRDLDVLRGLLNPERGLPLIGTLMITGAMASAGIPGMVGFISEFLVFRGSFPVFPVQTLLCMVGTGLTGVYLLILLNRAFFGRLAESSANLPSVVWGDRLPSIVLAVLILVLGIQPSLMVRWSESTSVLLAPHSIQVSSVN
ncbi:proton-translocating NADH-quinone oxidoreductase, chain M [Synechococcus sp. PCC 7502]|uniref:NADH-quinone oxidoreductase subunit M n=1 Tax=Synechococcus sp. PCC 7502 TaxID=1173263 RepID=UPI00029FA296|nr:NADH-quinone oxidoreductase subunit M [Synechococcus sp. PCC 7502]AFY72442.1 proton-translocating NADH-quinone oxidoreductase, chain M [Synechococcus sp. PCC 7502]